MLKNIHKYENMSDKEFVESLTTEPIDNKLFEYFIYEKCRKLLYYISANFNNSNYIGSVLGEFYEFISDNDWRVLKSWNNKNDCSLNKYLTSCAINYFSKKSNEEKKRCSHEFIPTDPEFINILEHFTAEEEYETQPVWEAYNMLEERERIVLRLLVIEKKSMKVAAPIIWKYIKSKKSFEETSEKNIQSTISLVKSRAILSLTKKLEELKKHFT